METPPTARRRRLLTLDEIVDAALSIADRDGLDAATMRRLSTDLGVGTMTLYHYVADKNRLEELIFDRVMGEVLLANELPSGWRDALSEIARHTRDAFLRHPWVADAFGRRRYVTPNMLRHVDQTNAAIEGLDAPRETAWTIVGALDDYALGHALREIMRRRWTAEGPNEGRLAAEVEELLESGELPYVTRNFAAGPPPGHRDDFERGLKWLLDGIEQELAHARPCDSHPDRASNDR